MESENCELSEFSKQVSMMGLKSAAMRLLPSKSVLRSLIISEPDVLPIAAAVAKLEIFVKLLYEELARKEVE